MPEKDFRLIPSDAIQHPQTHYCQQPIRQPHDGSGVDIPIRLTYGDAAYDDRVVAHQNGKKAERKRHQE